MNRTEKTGWVLILLIIASSGFATARILASGTTGLQTRIIAGLHGHGFQGPAGPTGPQGPVGAAGSRGRPGLTRTVIERVTPNGTVIYRKTVRPTSTTMVTVPVPAHPVTVPVPSPVPLPTTPTVPTQPVEPVHDIVCRFAPPACASAWMRWLPH